MKHVDVDIAHYQLSHADQRAEVQLGWERARFFLGVNVALLVASSAIATSSPTLARPLYGLGVVLSGVGALIVWRSHTRWRRARGALEQAAQRLGVEGPSVTGGQQALQGQRRGASYRVVVLVIAALAACGVVGGAMLVAS